MRKTWIVALLASLLIMSCATVEEYSGKALLAVGGAVAKAMEGSSSTVGDVTPFIKLQNVNRPRPYTALEADYMAKAGIEAPDNPSGITILFSKGMKLLEIDGEVQVNGKDMTYYGSGSYIEPMDVETGEPIHFHIKGSDDEAVDFSEMYKGEKITLTSPAPGSTIDLSKGFDITWTPGSDSTKMVKLSMIVTQIGLENVLPVGIFKDVGSASITPTMLSETLGPAVKFKPGANTLYLERQRDEVRYLFNGDAVVSFIDADGIEVTVVNEPPKPNLPAIEAVNATEGDVTVVIGETKYKYNPVAGALPFIHDIKKIGLSSFVFKGVTGGSWQKSKTTETAGIKTTTTTTKRWGKDFGVPVLTNSANIMADGIMAALTVGLNAEEVPKDDFINTAAYQRMADLKPKSDDKSFVVKARDLADFSSWKNIKIRVGGTESWYFDMLQSSGADALAEVYVTATRQEPKDGAYDDFIFNMNIRVDFKAFQDNILMRSMIPAATADYVSKSITITPETTYEELMDAFKIDAFMLAYAKALDAWVDANEALES